MKKMFNKFTKILLLVGLMVSELMTPIKVFAAENDEVAPQNGDVGINETISDETEGSVTKGSLDNPGDVQVTKTVKKNGEGKFTIEFEVKGKNAESYTTVVKPVYVVIVLDTSGSMICDDTKNSYAYDNSFDAGWHSAPYTAADGKTIYCSNAENHSNYILKDKWENAVSGAVTFSENLAELDNTYVSVVTFASTASTATTFTHGALSNSAFNHPVGGTNLQQGLNNAKSALDSITDANAQKYIVVIGDGEPTFYGNGVKDNDENHNYPTATSYAKTAADNIKNSGINIFTIGYGIEGNTTAQNILKYVSSNTNTNGTYTDNGYYQSSDSVNIVSTFQTVFNQLNTALAGTGAILTDNIGSSFSVNANSSNLITITGSSVSTTEEFDITEEGTIISFDVEINGDEAEGWVNVNEGFSLTYTDANGETKTISYTADEPQPQVYWERNTYSYVINYYKDEITNTSDDEHYLGTSGNLSAYNGEEITLSDTEKNAYLPQTGYELSDNNVYTITIDKTEDNIINVLYKKIGLTYGVNYLFESSNGYTDRNDVSGTNNINAEYGDEVSYTNYLLENIPTGFELNTTMTEGSNNGTYTITDNTTVINIYYSKLNLTYDVKYLFEDLNGNYVELGNIAGINDIDAKYGDEVSYSDHTLASVPEGYALDTVKNTENNNGKYVIINNDTVVYVYYKRINSNFTVNYYFNGEFDEIYSYSNDAIYGSTLNAIDYKLETVNNEYLQNKKTTDNEDYFLNPVDVNNNSSITIGTGNNNMTLYYVSTFFENNSESISKTVSTDGNKVTSSNQVVNYTVNYSNKINNVREGDIITVNFVDTLPFKGTVTNLTNGCTYDNNKTISCTFTETASEFKSEYIINKEAEYSVVYKDFASISSSNNPKLINSVTGKTTLTSSNTTKETAGVTDTAEVNVEILGNLIVHHYEVGTTNSVYSDQRTNGLVGSSYETNYRTDLISYTVDTDNMPTNTEGEYAESDTVVTYYYVRVEGTVVAKYLEKDNETNVLETEYSNTGLVGTDYETPFKPVFGYTLDREPENKEGTYINGEILVKYLYNKNNGIIDDVKTEKVGPDSVDSIDSEFDYTIEATGTVKDYVGTIKVKVVDTLPFSIDTERSTLDNRCSYDGKTTITCMSEEKTITERDYIDGEYSVNELFTLSLVYNNIDAEEVSNKAIIEIILDNNSKTSEENTFSTEVKKGTILVSYIDEEGNELDSYTTTDLAGNEYNAEEKEFDGYTISSRPENAEGLYVADETIYVEYVYSKNIGTYEELPPQTGYEGISTNYVEYILVALFMLLIGKKKESKNN